jgi:hypothetical protein
MARFCHQIIGSNAQTRAEQQQRRTGKDQNMFFHRRLEFRKHERAGKGKKVAGEKHVHK